MSCSVKYVEGSICAETGRELWTFQLRYWRAIHGELMTHRVFSRNAGSSRATPVRRMISQVWNDPAMPVHWGVNQAGMQAQAELSGWRKTLAMSLWKGAAKVATGFTWGLMKLGVHKQVANRLLEPWQYINVLVTSTEWQNFFDLRCHRDAQPEFQELANMIRWTMGVHREAGTLRSLAPGEWHLPYILDSERGEMTLEHLLKLSAARAARVSISPFDGDASHAKEFHRHDLLVGSKPIHASPTEHQAMCLGKDETSANFRGFVQYRWFLENKARATGYVPRHD